MKINIKATNIELNDALRFWVQEKIGELDKLLGKFSQDDFSGGREKVEAWVEIGKTTRHHLKGDVFRAEIQIHLPKKSLRAEVTDIDLRTAINSAKEEIRREVRKYKGKRSARTRKWARKTKERIRTTEVLLPRQRERVFKMFRKGK